MFILLVTGLLQIKCDDNDNDDDNAAAADDDNDNDDDDDDDDGPTCTSRLAKVGFITSNTVDVFSSLRYFSVLHQSENKQNGSLCTILYDYYLLRTIF